MFWRYSISVGSMPTKKFMEAKDYYERLVEITPDDPMAWYNLAGVYVELDNPQVSDYNTIDMASFSATSARSN